MKTGHHGGLPVYGPRPSEEEMGRRAKRDGFDAATLRPALELAYGGRHWVEVWARPSPHPYMRLVDSDQDGPVYQSDPGWLVYCLRRDGRVQCSGQTCSGDRLVMTTELPFPDNLTDRDYQWK